MDLQNPREYRTMIYLAKVVDSAVMLVALVLLVDIHYSLLPSLQCLCLALATR